MRDGIDRPLVWKPSRDDRRNHPELPADASVAGRLIVRQVQPGNGGGPFLLALFTTLEAKRDAIVELYGQRWNIETDLRSLKGTLKLEELTCTTPEMVAKEIDLAMLAYNARGYLFGCSESGPASTRLRFHPGAQCRQCFRPAHRGGHGPAPGPETARRHDVLRGASPTSPLSSVL